MRLFCTLSLAAAIAIGHAEMGSAAEKAPARVPIEEMAPARVVIEMGEYDFTPADVTIPLHRPTIIMLWNRGNTTHYFGSEELFAAVEMLPPKAPMVGAHIIVAPGKTREIRIRASQPGTFDFTCHIPIHVAFGMTGKITIKATDQP